MCKASVYALSREFIVMISENPGYNMDMMKKIDEGTKMLIQKLYSRAMKFSECPLTLFVREGTLGKF